MFKHLEKISHEQIQNLEVKIEGDEEQRLLCVRLCVCLCLNPQTVL